MATHRFTAILEPAEEGGYVVKCLELPVASQGDTKEEALANIKEAVEGYLEVKAMLLREVKGEMVEIIVEAPPPSWRDVVKGADCGRVQGL